MLWLPLGVQKEATLLLFIFLHLLLFVRTEPLSVAPAEEHCQKDVIEDVCPQREGYDVDCERRCLTLFPLRISSACHLRSTGTLLSFFGIRSFACRCVLPASYCSSSAEALLSPARLAFSLPAVQTHSTLNRLSIQEACAVSPSSFDLHCSSFTDCGWRRSSGASWFAATAHGVLPFAPSESPQGEYLLAVTSEGTTTVSIQTCASLCSLDDVNISGRVWRAPWVTVQLCFIEGSTDLCQNIPAVNGNSFIEVLPQTRSFSVSFRFANLSTGDAILLDDLFLSYTTCPLSQKMAVPLAPPSAPLPSSILSLRQPSLPSHSAFPPTPPSHTIVRSSMFSQAVVADPPPLLSSSGLSICHGASCHRARTYSRICSGRAAHIKCQAKCRTENDGGNTARCVRDPEPPHKKRCVCNVRLAPRIQVAIEEKQELAVVEMKEGEEKEMEVVEMKEGEEKEMAVVEMQLKPPLCSNDSQCNQLCPSSMQSRCMGGECSCSPCLQHTCDLERAGECGWADMSLLSPQFNNISVAAKKGQNNRYGLSRMLPRSYSGVFRRGAMRGPLSLSVDVFPSHGLDVRICIDSLQTCQSQRVQARAWNRVSAHVKMGHAQKIFLLFYNKAAMEKTIAIDNISLESGECGSPTSAPLPTTSLLSVLSSPLSPV